MAAAQQTFYETPSPWPSPLYETFNVLVDYSNIKKQNGLDYNQSIFSKEFKQIFDLLTKIAVNISDTSMKNDMELAHSIGKDLLRSTIEIVLNDMYTFQFKKDSEFTHEELTGIIQNPNTNPEMLRMANEQLQKMKPLELQAIEQLYKFLNDNSCTINTHHFLFILIGIQQTLSNNVLNSIQEKVLQHIKDDYTMTMMKIKPFVDKTIFNIQCNPSNQHLSIRTTLKYHLIIATSDDKKTILLPFKLTDIVFVLDLTDIGDLKPGLTLEDTPVHELFKMYSTFYSIFQNVPHVLTKTTREIEREIDYNVFSSALKKKIEDRIKNVENRGNIGRATVEERLALKGFMGGKQQKKSPRIRRVSKKRFKRSRREKNQRKSKQNK
jgi:hypothetical protein